LPCERTGFDFVPSVSQLSIRENWRYLTQPAREDDQINTMVANRYIDINGR